MDFRINDGVLEKYTGNGGSVTIPEGVISIGESAFYWCENLTDVTIPEGVTSIGNEAFAKCWNLANVTIPEGLSSIGKEAFAGCEKLTGITIPKSISNIGDAAFLGCTSLAGASGLVVIRDVLYSCKNDVESVVIPDNVTCIDDYSFSNCRNLTNITIPNSVTTIGASAFFNCRNLTSVTIPSSVSSIGEMAFSGCNGLADTSGMVIVCGVLYSYMGNAESVVIPKGVISISPDVFRWRESLKSVIIPEGVTNIGDEAFLGCSGLVNITIPDSVTNIGNKAFCGCTGLADASGLVVIRNVLYNCKQDNVSVVIPDNVTNISESAFRGCSNLELSLPAALLSKLANTLNNSAGVVLRDGGKRFFLAYPLPQDNWQEYDLGLAGASATYKYKLSARLLGALGRLENPVELTEDFRKLFLELLAKNAKKLLATAEKLHCPEIIQALLRCSALNEQKEAAYRKQLEKSSIPEIAALAQWQADDRNATPRTAEEVKPLSEAERMVLHLLQEEGKTAKDVTAALDKFYGLKPLNLTVLPELHCNDGSPAGATVLAYLLSVHERLEEYASRFGGKPLPDVNPNYEVPGICPHAAAVVSLLDPKDFQKVLLSLADQNLGQIGRSRKMFLAYPICRYADEATMEELTKRAPKWASSVSGSAAPPLYTFRKAACYSETHAAMLFAERYHDLGAYAALRGMSEDAVRDQFLSDIGLDELGGRNYDLGNQAVTVRLQPDLSFLVELADGKTAKSLPKKGADPERYEVCKADFDQRRKDAKRIVKSRCAVIFEDFLSGRKRSAEDWQAAYLKNPLLRSVAKLIVWSQGKSTFTLANSGAIRSNGKPYKIGKGDIQVAHPIEMKPENTAAWQEYFRTNDLKQPFEQVWEPAFAPESVKADRYNGCTVFYRRVQNAEKHGIHYYDVNFHNDIGFELDGCKLENVIANWHRHYIEDDTTFTLGKFTFKKYTRKVNHIVYLFDKWTIWDRIRKDDMDVIVLLDRYNAAQITEFLNIAVESHATNLTAALLDYKHAHFAEYDAFSKFTLD